MAGAHAILYGMQTRRSTHRFQAGFTTIELVLVCLIICILLALVVTTRAGVKQNERNTERQHDIKELRKEAKREGRSFVKHLEYILTRWFTDRGIDVDEQEIKRKNKQAKEAEKQS